MVSLDLIIERSLHDDGVEPAPELAPDLALDSDLDESE